MRLKTALLSALAVLMCMLSVGMTGTLASAEPAADSVGWTARFDADARHDTWRWVTGGGTVPFPEEDVTLSAGEILENEDGGTSVAIQFQSTAGNWVRIQHVMEVDLDLHPYLYYQDTNFTGGFYYNLAVGREGGSDTTVTQYHYHETASEKQQHRYDLREFVAGYAAGQGKQKIVVTFDLVLSQTVTALYQFDYLLMGNEEATMPQPKPVGETGWVARFDRQARQKDWFWFTGASTVPFPEEQESLSPGIVLENSNGGTSIAIDYTGNAGEWVRVLHEMKVDLDQHPYLYYRDANVYGGFSYTLRAGRAGGDTTTVLDTHYHQGEQNHKIDLRQYVAGYAAGQGVQRITLSFDLVITENGTNAAYRFGYLFMGGDNAPIPKTEFAAPEEKETCIARFDAPGRQSHWLWHTENGAVPFPSDNAVLSAGETQELDNGGTTVAIHYKGNAGSWTSVSYMMEVDLDQHPFLFYQDTNFTGGFYYNLAVGRENGNMSTVLNIHYHNSPAETQDHQYDLRKYVAGYEPGQGKQKLRLTFDLVITQNDVNAEYKLGHLFMGTAAAERPWVIEENPDYPVKPAQREEPEDANIGWIARMDDEGKQKEWFANVDGKWVPFDQLPAGGAIRPLETEDNEFGGTTVQFELFREPGSETITFGQVLHVMEVDLDEYPYLYYDDGPFLGGYYMGIRIGVPSPDYRKTSRQVFDYHYHEPVNTRESHVYDLRDYVPKYKEGQGKRTIWIIFEPALAESYEDSGSYAPYLYKYLLMGNDRFNPAPKEEDSGELNEGFSDEQKSTLRDTGSGATATGYIEAGTVLSVIPIEEAANLTYVENLIGDRLSNWAAYDVGFYLFDAPNAPEKGMLYTWPIPQGVDRPAVYWLPEEGDPIRMDIIVGEDTLAFNTKEMGLFVIGTDLLGEEPVVEYDGETESGSSPDTGDPFSLPLLILAGGSAGSVLLFKKRRS